MANYYFYYNILNKVLSNIWFIDTVLTVKQQFLIKTKLLVLGESLYVLTAFLGLWSSNNMKYLNWKKNIKRIFFLIWELFEINFFNQFETIPKTD